MKIHEVIEILEKEGWTQIRMKGSHRQFKHPYRRGLVTIAGHRNDDLSPGTLHSILKQAGLK